MHKGQRRESYPTQTPEGSDLRNAFECPPYPLECQEIGGVILAGGAGRRMGGMDKGWQQHGGIPLVTHVLNRLRPQIGGQITLSANRNIERYQSLTHAVVTDEQEEGTSAFQYQGPLAGIYAGLKASTDPWILVCPCDTPDLPSDLAQQMRQALVNQKGQVAIARTPERAHYTCLLLPSRAYESARISIQKGERRLHMWLKQFDCAWSDFVHESSFANINTLDSRA